MCITVITKDQWAELKITVQKVEFNPEDISARSMHAGGAMVLLLARFDTKTIKIVCI